MFSTIRLILVFVFVFFSLLLLKKTGAIRTKVGYVLICCIAIFLIFALPFIPFENAFFTFKSPIQAFNYYNSTSKEVKLVIEGESTDFIVGGDVDSNINLIVPKTDSGWKVGLGKDIKRVFQKNIDGYSICVYQYKDSCEYYLSVLKIDGGDFEINDLFNSNFYSLSKYSATLNETYYTYYAYIPDFNGQYIIVLDGTEICMGNANRGTNRGTVP